MKYKKIVIEVEEDDGNTTYREIDLQEGIVKDVDVSTVFIPDDASEVLNISVKRVTKMSKDYAAYVNNPWWKR